MPDNSFNVTQLFFCVFNDGHFQSAWFFRNTSRYFGLFLPSFYCFWFLTTVTIVTYTFHVRSVLLYKFSNTTCLFLLFFCVILFQNCFRLPLLFSFWHISHYKWSFCIVCTELIYIFRIFYYCIKCRYGFIILSKMAIWFWSTSNLLSVIVFKYHMFIFSFFLYHFLSKQF